MSVTQPLFTPHAETLALQLLVTPARTGKVTAGEARLLHSCLIEWPAASEITEAQQGKREVPARIDVRGFARKGSLKMSDCLAQAVLSKIDPAQVVQSVGVPWIDLEQGRIL